MSNNAPDYDNLYFEPIGDMSKLNDCNDGKRGSDVLMLTLEKCQKIVARNVELEKKLTKMGEKLKIARKALEFIVKTIPSDKWVGERDLESCYRKAEQALEKIKD